MSTITMAGRGTLVDCVNEATVGRAVFYHKHLQRRRGQDDIDRGSIGPARSRDATGRRKPMSCSRDPLRFASARAGPSCWVAVPAVPADAHPIPRAANR